MENQIGKQIAERRKSMGMTQDQLADRLGVTKQAVSKWENEVCCPDITILPELAEIFGCTTDALFGLTREEPQEKPEKRTWELSFGGTSKEEGAEKSGINLEWHSGKKTDLGIALWVLLIGLSGFAGEVAKNKGMGQEFSYWTIAGISALLAYGIVGLWPKFSAFRLLCALGGGYFLCQSIFILRVSLNSELLFPAVLLLLGLGMLSKQLGKKKKPEAPDSNTTSS